MSQIMSVDPPLQITFSVSTEKLRTFSDEGENSLLETNSILHSETHTFNCRSKRNYTFRAGGLALTSSDKH